MHRDEESSSVCARKTHPFRKRDKRVIRTCHRDPEFASALELLTQCLRKSEDDILFKFSARTFGTVVDAAMTGIKHDQRARIPIDLWRRLARPDRNVVRRMFFERYVAHKAGTVRGDKIEHQPRRVPLRCIEHKGL